MDSSDETSAEASELELIVKEDAEDVLASMQIALECDYSLAELKRVDHLLFTKFKVRELGMLYACISIYVCAVPAIICYLFNKELAGTVLRTCLMWSPILIPLCALHTWRIYKERIASLEEAFKADEHVVLELSQLCLTVRSKETTNNFQWQHFTGCLSTPDNYICMLNTGPIIIPKRLLDDSVKSAWVELLLRLKITEYQEIE